MRVSVLIAAAALCACAAAPKYGEQDERALAPARQAYQACIAQQTHEVINGSDDVGFLVNYIVQQCEPFLAEPRDYLTKRKFNPYFIQRFLDMARDQARQVTSSFILRAKSGNLEQ